MVVYKCHYDTLFAVIFNFSQQFQDYFGDLIRCHYRNKNGNTMTDILYISYIQEFTKFLYLRTSNVEITGNKTSKADSNSQP